MLSITPVHPDDAEAALTADRDATVAALRRTLGMRFPTRRTLGRWTPTRRTLGGRFPSRRTLGGRFPSRRTLGIRRGG